MAKAIKNKNNGINNLSDAALQHILSFLPTKNAVQTSLLSRRWRYLWTRVPVLDIDCSKLLCNSDDVYAAILMHRKYSPIKKLQLQFHDNTNSPYNFAQFDDWIHFSMHQGVQELYLDCAIYHPAACPTSDHAYRTHGHKLPIGLMTYKYLRVLSLKDCRINACARMDFRCLETLQLSHPRVSPQELQQLIDSCPLLSSFVLKFYEDQGNLKIRCQNLKSMKLICCHNLWRIELDMPNLQSFYYKGDLPWDVFLLTNPVNLINAEICFCRAPYMDNVAISFRDFISKFGQAKFLRVITPKFEEFVITKNLSEGLPPIFQRLKQLELKESMTSTNTIFAIANLLEISPNLEVLSMIFNQTATKMHYMFLGERKKSEFQVSISCLRHHQMMMDNDMESDNAEFHELPKVSYSCLQHHLRKIKLINFQGVADEMKLAKFLIGSAIALEKIYIQGIKQTFCHHMRVKRMLLRWRANPHTEVLYV